MTDPHEQPRHEGTVGALSDLGQRLVTALPPGFVVLCLINVIFLGLVMWFLNSQIDARTKMVGTFMDRCMTDMANHGAVEARLDALEHDVRNIEVDQRRK